MSPGAGLDDLLALLITPATDAIVNPLHRDFVNRLQEVVFTIGLIHQHLNGLLYALLFRSILESELRSILTKDIIVNASEDLSGAVATLDGSLVDVLVKSIVRTAEQRAVDDIHIGIIRCVRQGIATEFCS